MIYFCLVYYLNLLQIGEKNKGWGCVEKEVGTKLIIQYIKNIVSQKKKIDVHMFFFPFLCPGIPDLVLGILKMLIRVCFRDYNNQQPINLFLAWYDSQPVSTINVQYLQ